MIALVVTALAAASPALAEGLSGRVDSISPHASYEAWVVTSLDLTRPDQPAARAAVDRTTGEFEVPFDPAGRPFWVFLHERFQPEGGAPFELFLPLDLIPSYELPGEPVLLRGIDPAVLMKRQRMSTAPDVLIKLGVICLLVFGAGFGLRRWLAPHAAVEGGRCAPLSGASRGPPEVRGERIAIAVILVVATGLRLRGFFGESLDLLEVSYLPGIGRPAPFAAGLDGFAAVPHMLAEMGRLYCIDLTHPPGYHFVMGVFGLFGDAGWILRLPGLAASLVTLWLLWRFFRRWSVAAGLASAATFAVCAPGIYFGQDATPYSTVGLVAIGSLMLMIDALQTGQNRAWSRYFGVIVIGFYLHYNVALMAVGQLAMMLVFAWWGRADKRWAAAIHRAMRPALMWAPWPLAWTWLHLSTFDTIAQDTRLVADVYMPDAGLLSYTWDFWSVMAGLDVDVSPWSAAAAAGLVLLALAAAVRPGEGAPPRAVGLLLAAMTAGFVGSIAFFYVNVVDALAGHVFYGFRWVGCFLPVLIGVAVLGVVQGAGPRLLRYTLAAVWAIGLGMATVTQVTEASRPDYAAVTSFIRSELKSGDGIATLPSWFQRGNIAYYLLNAPGVRRQPDKGEGVWVVDDKDVTVETIHASLPFETTARNAHVDRLWVAVVDERMSGRSKFQDAVAEQALAWADAHMVREGEWEFDRIRLLRYRRALGDLAPAGETVVLSTDRAVLNHRLYPPLEGRARFVAPEQLAGHPALGPTVLYQAPMSPGCVDWRFRGLKPALQPAAPHHWYFDLRIPAPADRPPSIDRPKEAQVHTTVEPGRVHLGAVGGPCDGPPLQVRIR